MNIVETVIYLNKIIDEMDEIIEDSGDNHTTDAIYEVQQKLKKLTEIPNNTN
jgi:hypothetical protein